MTNIDPPAPPPPPRDRVAGTFLLGTTITLLYGLCVVMVVVAFSSYVIRTEWSVSLANESGDIRDVDSLIWMIGQEDLIKSRIADLPKETKEAAERLAAAHHAVQQRERGLVSAKEARHRVADQALDWAKINRLKLIAADQPVVMDALDKPDPSTDVALGVLALISELTVEDDTQAEAVLEEAASHKTAVMDAIKAVEGWENAILDAERHLRLAIEEDEVQRKELDHFQARQIEVRTALQSYTAHRARWRSMGEDNSWWNPVPSLVRAPTILLTLMATIAAGALGTLVAFSRRYTGSTEGLQISRLAVSMGEGIAAAIGVFLFAGAGLLMLTQDSGSKDGLELSPFTVAFIAFLSGFMADRAFAKMREAGENLFRVKDGQHQDGTDAGADNATDDGTPAAGKTGAKRKPKG